MQDICEKKYLPEIVSEERIEKICLAAYNTLNIDPKYCRIVLEDDVEVTQKDYFNWYKKYFDRTSAKLEKICK